MRKFPKNEKELTALADKYNITYDSSTTDVGLDRAEIQRRILAIMSERRNSNLWIIALISSIASVISAITAIIAVLCK